MSLVKKPEMTEENLAAHRANGAKSQGPVTPEGKANSAAANLRHGLYSQAQDQVMVALGEDPQQYAELMNSLETDLAGGLERELKKRIARTLWHMRRIERMQDGLALKRQQSASESEHMVAALRLARASDLVNRLEAMEAAVARRHGPTPAEAKTFVESFGDTPSEEMQEILLRLRSLYPSSEQGDEERPSRPPGSGAEEMDEQERKKARRELRTLLNQKAESFQLACQKFLQDCENAKSSENLAALMAPQNEQSLGVQRLEETNLRQLWRLTNVLFKVRSGALAQRKTKSADRSGDVYEIKGASDKMDENVPGFLTENSPESQ